MKDKCCEIRTTSTRCCTHNFTVTSFELRHTPALDRRMMEQVVKPFPLAKGYLDDIIIFSQSLWKHLYHINPSGNESAVVN